MFFARMLQSTDYMILVFMIILLVISAMIMSWYYGSNRTTSGFTDCQSNTSNQVKINLHNNQILKY